MQGKTHFHFETLSQEGENYAVAGAMIEAGYTFPYVTFLNQFNLSAQLKTLLKQHPLIEKQDLFIVMIGGNDLLYVTEMNAKNRKEKEAMIINAVYSLEKTIVHLIEKGAKHIIVVNVPEVGFTPRYFNSMQQRLVNHLAKLFNQKLNIRVNFLKKKHSAIEIKLFDLNKIFLDYLTTFKGKKNITDPCIQDIFSSFNSFFNLRTFLVGGFLVKYEGNCNSVNINNYSFFDSIHPIASLHLAVGNELYALINAKN